MVRILLALIVALGLAAPAAAQSDDIQKTIEGQMQAFQSDDFAQAFSFAAPNIKGTFGTAERFGLMVRRGYPMVWKNREVTFLDLRERSGNLWQRVQVEDQTGDVHYLDYLMVQTAEGWQIAGVTFTQPPGVGA